MVDAKLYGFVNLKVKKEVADLINNVCKEYDITISDCLFEVLNDKIVITTKFEAKRSNNLK